MPYVIKDPHGNIVTKRRTASGDAIEEIVNNTRKTKRSLKRYVWLELKNIGYTVQKA